MYNIKCGIIGLPNIGKSTIFNLLTNSNIKVNNFPFTTINPNIGYYFYLNNKLIQLKKKFPNIKINPLNIKFIDIAGLIKDAYRGKGLGNYFLDNIRSTNVLLHIIRCFNNKKILHIYNNINPIRDIYIINKELIYKDLDICNNALCNKKTNDIQKKILFKIKNFLKKNILLNKINFLPNEIKILKFFNFITLKPIIYILNTSNINFFYKSNILNYFYKNKLSVFILNINIFNKKKKIFIFENYKFLINNITNKLIYKIIYFLKLKNFFTINDNLIKSWLLHSKDNLLNAANAIHTDFNKLFIKGEVIHYNDFIKYKNIKILKKYAKIFIKSKKYIFKDNDIINIILNKKKCIKK